MAEKAVDLLDGTDEGFFLMIEGAHIDKHSHSNDGKKMTESLLEFDRTVAAMLDYAEKAGETLVVVTADHAPGGVKLPDNPKPEDINDSCFTSDGEHTNVNVWRFASGAQSKELCEKDVIDNTDIAKYMRKVLSDSHK